MNVCNLYKDSHTIDWIIDKRTDVIVWEYWYVFLNYFKNVIKNIKKVKKIKNKPHNIIVKKFGKAWSYPGTFNGSIHAIITSKNFKNAVIKTIKAGGCNCSRANFVGAYFAAKNGLKSIPKDWIKKTNPAKNILKYIV